MRLSLCSRCERHVAPSDPRCPFCNAKLGTVDARAVGAAWVMVAGLAVVGCAPDKSSGMDDPSCDADGGDDTCTADSGDTTTEDSGGATTEDSDYGGEDYAGGGDYTDSESDYGGEDYAGGGDYTDEYGEDTAGDTADTGSETGSGDTGSGDTGSEDSGTGTGTGTDTDTDTTEPPDGTEDSGGEDYAGPPPDARDG